MLDPAMLDMLIAIARVMLESARRCIEGGQSVPPTFVVLGENDVFTLVPPDFGTPEEKDRAILAIKEIARRVPNLIGVVSVLDCNTYAVDAKGLAAHLGMPVDVVHAVIDKLGLPPPQYHQFVKKQECLLARAETYVGDWDCMILYSRDGEQVLWQPPVEGGVTNITGRFVGLLPGLATTPGQS